MSFQYSGYSGIAAETVVVAEGHAECASLSLDLLFPSFLDVSVENGPALRQH
jgi:hypothetical protein